jgi:hypothetical protein
MTGTRRTRMRTLSSLQRGQEEAREPESEEPPAWEPEEDERVAANDKDEDVDLGATTTRVTRARARLQRVPHPLLWFHLSGCEGPRGS